jgi:DNA-binding Xre family transcriptional regulator
VINRFLNGKPIDYLNAEKICRALNLDLGEITGCRVKPESVSQVKAALENNGLDQTDLGGSLGLSRDVINRFLNGKPIDYLNAEKICRALNLDLGEITGCSQPRQRFSPKTKLKGLRRHRKP